MLLLERDSQLQGLDSALSQVKAGAGCVALVYGEAGIGKTSLVEYFLKDKGKAWRMLRGACDSLFTPRPLGPLHDIALETQGRLLSLLDSEGNRTAIFSACLTELKSQSTILVIEDIHWADEATLDLLKYLGRRIGQTPSLMILTYRDDEIGIDHPLRLLVGDLGSQNTLHRISVSALSRQAVQELAKDKKVDTAELHRLTNGNPFFVTEALAAGSGVPETVRDAVLARAARLSAPARNLLEAAAVIGLRMEPWLLSKISEEEAGRIEECISRGMLQLQGNYYAFRHELARQTILEAISPQRRIALHRKILNALKESPDVHYDLARLANHAEGTGDANAVLEYAPAAARQASAAAAHREAAALYELALRFADVLPPLQRIQMLEAYAGEEWFLHRSERLIALCRDIIEKYHVLGDGLREGGNLALLAVELHSLGRTAEEQEAIQAAIGILEQLPPGAELARAYGVHGFLLAEKLDYLGGIAASEKAIALAERFRDFDTLARACTNVGSSMLSMGDERGRAPMERALAVAREHDLHYASSLTFANWAVALVQTFQFEEAGDLLQEGVDYATGHDVDYLLVGLLHLRAQIQVYQGYWMEAAGLLRETRRPRISRFLSRYLAYIFPGDLVRVKALQLPSAPWMKLWPYPSRQILLTRSMRSAPRALRRPGWQAITGVPLMRSGRPMI